MKRFSIAIACIVLLAAGGLFAQSDPDVFRLHLKTGEILEGELKSADEDGVKLDIGDDIELFIRWTYTRGDKHYELRKKQTDFKVFDSVMRLADFCHDFAMDEQESYVLVAALKLDPENEEARERLDALPEIKGLEIPGEDAPEPKEQPATEDEEPEEELPPPTRGPFKVWIDMQSEDDATKTWLAERFEDQDYRIGSSRDHEIRIEVEIELKLVRNPTFMGAELYAVYDGKLTFKAWRDGQESPFTIDTVKAEEVRRDSKDEARTSCRDSLLKEAFRKLFDDIEKQR